MIVGGVLKDPGAGCDVSGEPDVTADDGALTDGDAPEDGRAGVDNDVVFDNGVAGDAFNEDAFFVFGEAFCTEGNALIEADVVSDDAGFTDDGTGTVVDKEVLADGGTGVNIDTCDGVGHFCNDSGNQFYAKVLELVSNAIIGHSGNAWVAENGFTGTDGSGVAFEGGHNVSHEQATKFWEGIDEASTDVLGFLFTGITVHVIERTEKTVSSVDLLGKKSVNFVQVGADVIAHGSGFDFGVAEIAGKEDSAESADNLGQGLDRRHGGVTL